MMDAVSVPLDRFDLQGFIDAYREFYRSWAGEDSDPDISVMVSQRSGDVPMPIDGDRDLFAELTELGWLLFFQVHEPLADDTALCIDGSRESSDKFDIGVADGYGFLVEVRDGQVHLHGALYPIFRTFRDEFPRIPRGVPPCGAMGREPSGIGLLSSLVPVARGFALFYQRQWLCRRTSPGRGHASRSSLWYGATMSLPPRVAHVV